MSSFSLYIGRDPAPRGEREERKKRKERKERDGGRESIEPITRGYIDQLYVVISHGWFRSFSSLVRQARPVKYLYLSYIPGNKEKEKKWL
jgi:hypothetical protein